MNWGLAMDNDRDHQDDTGLEALLAAARRAEPVPDADFLSRLEADMEDSLPGPAPASPTGYEPGGFLARFRTIFAASGLTGAAALGVWIGFVMPDTLNALVTGFDTAEASGIGAFLPHADLAALQE